MKRFFAIFFCCFFVYSALFSDDETIKAYISKMSIEDKASQVLMMSIEGKKTFPPYLSSYFDSYTPVLLFYSDIIFRILLKLALFI